MKWKKIKAISLLAALIVLVALANSLAFASVEWEIIKTLDMEAVPIDVALSPDGKRLFVLTDKGNILVYSSGDNPVHKISVGDHVDQIKMGPKGHLLILSSRKNRKVQLITLDFIQNINVSGSPFKGDGDTPVVVAVFSDFE